MQNFYIRGIAAFGSKTFGATGTNTVVMFLEKFNEPPKQIDLSADSVDAIFSGAELAGWKDRDIFEAYLAQIDIDENEYRAFLNKSLSVADLEGSEYFKMYVMAFADSSDAKNLLKTKAYQQKSAGEQAAAYLERLYSYAYSIEREKLFYFSLVYQQTTVIITAPADNKAQKEFIERKVDRPYGEVCNGGYTYFAEGDFIIAKITPCMENGKCAIAEGLTNGIGFGSSEFHTFRCHASEILTKFLFLLLNQTTVRKAAEDAMTGASGHRRVPAAFYEEMLIPVPPIPVQQQVIDECAKIDEEYNATRMSIETYRQKTADLFAELDAVMSTTEGNRLSLSDTEKFSVAIGKRVLDKELASNGTIPVYSANVTAPFGFIDKLLITDFSAPSVLWGIDGDWMTSYLPSDMPFYPTDHCGVLRCKNSEVNPRYLAHILEVEGRKMGFSRSYRASIDRVHGIAFTVPDISIQNNAMSKVADYEMAIKELEGSLEKIASRRSEIIRKALAE